MSAEPVRRPWLPMVFVLVAVVAVAISALLPFDSPRRPGTLHLGLPLVASDPRLQEYGQVLADHFGRALRRSARVVALGPVPGPEAVFDLALLPSGTAHDLRAVLARARSSEAPETSVRLVWVHRVGDAGVEGSSIRVIAGDSTLAGGPVAVGRLLDARGVGPDRRVLRTGHDVFDHAEAIAALIHGAYDLALLREGEIDAAVRRGWCAKGEFVEEPTDIVAPAFVLVAGTGLSEHSRRRLARAARDLDAAPGGGGGGHSDRVGRALRALGLSGFDAAPPTADGALRTGS